MKSALTLVIFLLLVSSSLMYASEIQLHTYGPIYPKSTWPGPNGVDHVVIIDIDGLKREVLYSLLADAPEEIPNISSLVGAVSHFSDTNDFMFHDALGVNRATTVCPSVTLPSQFAIVTGRWPKNHGIPANYWLSRRLDRIIDITGLLEAILPSTASALHQGPTILETAAEHGLTCVSGLSNVAQTLDVPQPMAPDLIDPVTFDTGMTTAILELINRNGIPRILFVYYPGNDVNSHSHGAETQFEYLSDILDPLVGQLLHGNGGGLSGISDIDPDFMTNTVFLFCSDHGHINVSSEEDHSIGSDDLALYLASVDFVMDDSALLIANGGVGLLYLKNRRHDSWTRPRFLRDVLPVARAIVDSRSQLGDFLDFMLLRVNNASDGQAYRVLDPNSGRIRSIRSFFHNRMQDYPDAVQRIFGTDPGAFGDIILFPNRSDGYHIAESPGVASDHGSLGAVESYVPMIFAGAVQPRTARQARNIDIAPTIANLLGLRHHWQNGDGRSLIIGR